MNYYLKVVSEQAQKAIRQLDYVEDVVFASYGLDDSTLIVDSKQHLTYSNLAELFALVVQYFGDQDRATVEVGPTCIAFVGMVLKPKVTISAVDCYGVI